MLLSHAFENVLKYFFQILVSLYRVAFSPFFGGACRFHPSCSCYAEDALKKFNFFYAIKLILIRLISCRPGGRSGYDPVPDLQKENVK